MPQEKQNGSEEYRQEDRQEDHKIPYKKMKQIGALKKTRAKQWNKNWAKQLNNNQAKQLKKTRENPLIY